MAIDLIKVTSTESKFEVAKQNHPTEWVKEFSVGDFIICGGYHMDCYQITSIELEQDKVWDDDVRKWVEINSYSIKPKAKKYCPFSDSLSDYVYTLSPSECKGYQVFKGKNDILDWIKYGEGVINNNVDEFLTEYNNTNDDEDNSTALVSLKAKDSYLLAKNDTSLTLNELEKKMAIVNLCIQEQQRKFDLLKSKCNNAISIVRRKITRIERALGQIELYLGVSEKIVQIQEGAPADYNEQIVFYQDVLYMDEEVGDYKDGGITFDKIQDFDSWLLRDNHLDIFLPSRGVRVFRVRRKGVRGVSINYGDHYVVNPYLENNLDYEDKQTYIIIRNGDNVYRIWADLIIYPYLFPKQDELQQLINKYNNNTSEYSKRTNKENVEDFIDKYQFNFCLLQGLLDRSDVLAPHRPINLFKDDFNTDAFKFVYDAEVKQVGDGHLSYWEFVKSVNKDIKEGSRVVLIDNYLKSDEDRFDNRFNSYHRRSGDDFGLPLPPKTDIYTVHKNSNGDFVIHYMPEKEYYFEKERKNKISFKIYNDDRFIINYDALDVETVEYYLKNRINRIDYLDIMPMLDTLRIKLNEEKALEEAFIMMIKSQVSNVSDGIISETIKWWKMKNKVKRPLTSNDQLAYKQILSKVKKFM
jgi:hypothetical protein